MSNWKWLLLIRDNPDHWGREDGASAVLRCSWCHTGQHQISRRRTDGGRCRFGSRVGQELHDIRVYGPAG